MFVAVYNPIRIDIQLSLSIRIDLELYRKCNSLLLHSIGNQRWTLTFLGPVWFATVGSQFLNKNTAGLRVAEVWNILVDLTFRWTKDRTTPPPIFLDKIVSVERRKRNNLSIYCQNKKEKSFFYPTLAAWQGFHWYGRGWRWMAWRKHNWRYSEPKEQPTGMSSI